MFADAHGFRPIPAPAHRPRPTARRPAQLAESRLCDEVPTPTHADNPFQQPGSERVLGTLIREGQGQGPGKETRPHLGSEMPTPLNPPKLWSTLRF